MNPKTKNFFSEERTIDLRELFWKFLEQWKAFIIISVCIAACYLGMVYIQNARTYERTQQNDANTHSAEEIINSLPKDKQAVVVGAYRLLQEREQLGKYVQTAPLMQLNSRQVDRLRMTWAVDAGDNQSAVIMAYATVLQGQECIQAIIDSSQIGFNSSQASELINISYPNKEGQDIICLDVYLTKDIQVEVLQEKIGQLIEKTNAQLYEKYIPHRIINTQNEIVNVADKNVFEKQVTVLNSFTNCNNQINSFKTTFSAEQREAFSKLESITNGVEPVKTEKTQNKTITLRNVVSGIVLGFIICLVLFVLQTILSATVYGASMIKNSSMRLIGEWYGPFKNSSKRSLFQDSFIRRKHHRNHLDSNTESENASNTINSICKYNDIIRILFVKTVKCSKEQDRFIEDCINKCVLNGIDIKCVEVNQEDNNIDDVNIINTDGLVLVVNQSKTKAKNIKLIVDRCNDYNKPIIGSVLLG